MFKNIRASLASFIHPGVSLPFAGNEPRPVQIVSASTAPVAAAGGPGTVTRGNPPELNSLIQAIATVRKASPSARAQAVAARPAPRPVAKAAPAPATDDSGVPVKLSPEPIDYPALIKQMEDMIETLKTQLPPDDDAGDEEAKAAASFRASGNLGKCHLALTRQFIAMGNRNFALSRMTRGQKMVAAFNREEGVRSVAVALHRTAPMTLAQRSSLALAPFGGRTPPARPAPVAKSNPPPDVVKIRSLKAELAQLDREQRAQFSNERNAKHAQLSAQLKAEIRKFRVS